MSDVAGIEELCDLRAAARASASIEAGKVIDSFCCRLEALLCNRQELVEVLEAFRADPVASIDFWEAAGAEEAYSKAKELDND